MMLENKNDQYENMRREHLHLIDESPYCPIVKMMLHETSAHYKYQRSNIELVM